ncbi:MAG: hypothetical protein ACUVTB_07730 [Candidatus Bathycorpusculaceae bacterium]
MSKSSLAKKEKLENLCQLILNLDSVRALRRVKPELIKEGFQNMQSKEFTEMWKNIRHDVEKIAYTPITEIKGLATLMRLVAFLKLLTPLTSIFMILVLASHFRSPEKLPIPLPTIFSEWTTFTIAVTLSLATMIALMAVDYTIRRKIIKYEEKHREKFSEGRERIRKVIEKLAAKFAEELERQGEDPNKYRMILFFKYKRLKVVKESRGRIFKRKYPLYEVICSLEQH